ncbi:hypothetical protein SBY92_004820 [Candida maltosa Xu316]
MNPKTVHRDIPSSPLSEFLQLCNTTNNDDLSSLLSYNQPIPSTVSPSFSASSFQNISHPKPSSCYYQNDYSSINPILANSIDFVSTAETSPFSDISDFLSVPDFMIMKPKRKSSPRPRTPIGRSRHACEGCKVRKVKCDEQKPSCTSCLTKGLGCNYTIKAKFKDDVEAMGKKFGREGINSLGGANETTDALVLRSKNSYYRVIRNRNNLKFLNFFINDVIENDHSLHICPSLQSSIIPIDVVNGSGLMNVELLNYAFDYYIQFISPIWNPVGDNSVTYYDNKLNSKVTVEKGLDLSSLIKYAQTNTAIFFLMFSLGSMYLSKRSDISEKAMWLSKAKHFQDLGLGKIQPEIEKLINHENYEFNTDLLVCLVLLILYEFANDCDRKWTVYLKLCKKLITSENFKIPKESMEYSLLKFCLEFLNYQESMGRTACKDVNMFFLELEQNEEDNKDTEKQIDLVSWMGCDRRLVTIISDITDLSFERFKNNVSEKDYAVLCQDMQRRLDEMKIKSEIDSTMSVQEICFLLSCEVNRLTTELYLQCCLLNTTPEDTIVTQLVHQIFKLLDFIVLKTNYQNSTCLVWSVFMASVNISTNDPDSDSLRYTSLSVIDHLKSQNLGQLPRIESIIRKIWKKRILENANLVSNGDLNKPARKRKKLMGFVNDWEKYVVKEDYAISF